MIGHDFLRCIKELGPREGESDLAFKTRLAGLREGRRVILEALLKSGGNNTTLAALLGIHTSNIRMTMLKYGVGGKKMQTKEELTSLLAELAPYTTETI